jgi:glycosyltransferase involved in cell wall biosynthesis
VRILQVVTRLGMGGAERVAETLATGFVARGNEVTFAPVAGVRDRAVADHMRDNLVARGVAIRPGASASNAKLAVAETAFRLARTVERAGPDLVHLHTEIPEFAWALAGLGSRRVRRVPVVRTVHNTVLWGGWGRAGRFAESRLEGARVAAVSEAARNAFAEWRVRLDRAPAEASVIYNGIDLAALADGPGTPHEPPLLCFAGRFEPQKGVDVLLAGLAGLFDGERRFRVEIHGDGTLAADVARAAERWPDRITVGPPVADLRSRLDAFDAILMPSRFEGMPLLAVEALSTGVPLLATDAPGLDEVLPDGYPGRCRPGDAAAYAAVIRDFLDDRPAWREAAIQARPETRSRFSLETMLDSYERLYAEALS